MSQHQIVKTIKIDGDFEGFDDEMLFKLMDGTYWVQREYKYWYHYAYCPTVDLLKSGSRYYIQVQGRNEMVSVSQITDITESKINGEFNGWEGETQYQLINGEVWKQTTYSYEYTYAYMPDVIIYDAGGGHKMKVEGTIADVQRIK